MIFKRFLITAFCLFVVSWFGCSVARQRRLEREFDKLTLGTPRREVLKAFGRPWKVEPCGAYFGVPQKDGCVEYLYRDPFAPLIPYYYAIEFDQSGCVKDKVPWSSP